MSDSPRELFLIDGNSLAYRAFFALPETIATSRGVPTNAIFGFASMLVKVLTEYGVNPTLVCWDAGMSGRETAYEEYKAERRKRPDLLSEQWPHLHPLVDAFGYTNVRVEGYEADDVMATLAVRAKEQKIPVMMVTGDRDMFQLIEPGIRVMARSPTARACASSSASSSCATRCGGSRRRLAARRRPRRGSARSRSWRPPRWRSRRPTSGARTASTPPLPRSGRSTTTACRTVRSASLPTRVAAR